MTTNTAGASIIPTNLQIHWHPCMSAVTNFFSDCPSYSLPSIISGRQELAFRIHFNFHLIGCLFKSVENRDRTVQLRRLYNFVFSCPTPINQKIHNVVRSLIGQMRSDFIMGIIDLSSNNLNFFINLSSKNFHTSCELVNRINQIPAEERQGILEFAIRILKDCPSATLRFLLDAIKQTPLSERDEVITITLSLLTNKENITRPHTLVNMIRRIPSHERREVLEWAIPLFSRPLHSDEVLDRVLGIVYEICKIPPNERGEVLELAGYLFSQNFCSDDIEREHVIHEIYGIPSNERREVVRLAKPLLDLRHFREHGMPVNSEYAIYIASQEYTVLSAVASIPSGYRRLVIYLAQPLFRESMDNPTRARVLRQIAREIIR